MSEMFYAVDRVEGQIAVLVGDDESTVEIPRSALPARVREGSGIATRAVGLIVDAEQGERIVAGGQADMVALARVLLDNPRWVWHAADRLGAKIAYPPQYARVAAALWPGARIARPADFPSLPQAAK